MDGSHMEILGKFFSFEGRVARGQYWITCAVLAVVTAIAYPSLWFISTLGNAGHIASVIGTAFGLFFLLWVSIAVSIRRWHDMDRSGAMMLISLVPLVGGLIVLIWLGFVPGTTRRNSYGRGGTEAIMSRRGVYY